MTYKETIEKIAGRPLVGEALAKFTENQWGMIVAYLKPEIISEHNKYNGWSNYATWRINLECIDGIEWDPTEVTFKDVASLAEYIKDSVETMVIGDGPDSTNLVVDYAHAFIAQVNYYEIAEHVAENYPQMITATDTQDGKPLDK